MSLLDLNRNEINACPICRAGGAGFCVAVCGYLESGVVICWGKKKGGWGYKNANEQLSLPYCEMINIPSTDQSRLLGFPGRNANGASYPV